MVIEINNTWKMCFEDWVLCIISQKGNLIVCLFLLVPTNVPLTLRPPSHIVYWHSQLRNYHTSQCYLLISCYKILQYKNHCVHVMCKKGLWLDNFPTPLHYWPYVKTTAYSTWFSKVCIILLTVDVSWRYEEMPTYSWEETFPIRGRCYQPGLITPTTRHYVARRPSISRFWGLDLVNKTQTIR